MMDLPTVHRCDPHDIEMDSLKRNIKQLQPKPEQIWVLGRGIIIIINKHRRQWVPSQYIKKRDRFVILDTFLNLPSDLDGAKLVGTDWKVKWEELIDRVDIIERVFNHWDDIRKVAERS